MASRFTKTEKWKDKWFVGLNPYEKLVWNYLCDSCDNAGFFEPNPRFDAYTIGITEKEFEGALKGLARGIIISIDKEKIYLKKFLFHQKNFPLNPANNAHKQIINLISLNEDKFNYDFYNLGANEGLISPIGKGNSNSKGIVKEGGTGGNHVVKGFFADENCIFELSKSDIENTIIFIQTTKKISLTEIDIGELLKAFKILNFNGKKYYENNAGILQHFRNWLKDQKHDTHLGSNSNSNKGHSRRNGGFPIVTGQLKEQLSQAATGGTEGFSFEI